MSVLVAFMIAGAVMPAEFVVTAAVVVAATVLEASGVMMAVAAMGVSTATFVVIGHCSGAISMFVIHLVVIVTSSSFRS